MILSLTIIAYDARTQEPIAPATKKNSARLVRFHSGMERPLLLPSKQFERWQRAALRSVEGHLYKLRLSGAIPIREEVNCRALIYRQRRIGDFCGYAQAVCDFLEKAGVVVNDRLIVQMNGTALLHDASLPRVEVELAPCGGGDSKWRRK